jgi:transcriptional regulator with XRE-family HTH domain
MNRNKPAFPSIPEIPDDADALPHVPAFDGKRCSRCHEVKPIEAFGINRATPSGRNYACLECSAKKARDARNASNKPRNWRLTRPGFAICTMCEKERSIEAFPKRPDTAIGIAPMCRDCRKIAARIYDRKSNRNPDAVKRAEQRRERKRRREYQETRSMYLNRLISLVNQFIERGYPKYQIARIAGVDEQTLTRWHRNGDGKPPRVGLLIAAQERLTAALPAANMTARSTTVIFDSGDAD